jgi:hypothetical protein
MPSSQATLARRRLSKLEVVKQATKTQPRRVDYYANATDFLVVALFNAGLETQAISGLTHLTEGQVVYRYSKSEQHERERAKAAGRKFVTARKAYRKGKSAVAQMIVSQCTGHSMVKRYVGGILDKKGLYAPRAKGVLRNTG